MAMIWDHELRQVIAKIAGKQLDESDFKLLNDWRVKWTEDVRLQKFVPRVILEKSKDPKSFEKLVHEQAWCALGAGIYENRDGIGMKAEESRTEGETITFNFRMTIFRDFPKISEIAGKDASNSNQPSL